MCECEIRLIISEETEILWLNCTSSPPPQLEQLVFKLGVLCATFSPPSCFWDGSISLHGGAGGPDSLEVLNCVPKGPRL